MKFHFDTEKCEDIQLCFDREGDLEENILDFSFGITALYTDFCMQLGLDAEDATSLLKVCQSCMTRNLEEFISNGMLDPDDEDDEVVSVSDEEIDELEQGMRAAGFSDEEISNIVDLVQDAGSMEAALNILKGIGEDAGVDWSEFENTQLPEDEEEESSSYEEFINGINLEDFLCDTPNLDAIKKGVEFERHYICSQEKMKKEATSRLAQLVNNIGLNPNVTKYWEEDGQLYYSYLSGGGFVGSIDKIDYDPKNVAIVKQFEAEYGSMVYHAIENKGTLILLSVSNDPDEWKYERLEKNVIMAYVHNFEHPDQSEFGDVALNAWQGALVRTRWCISYED